MIGILRIACPDCVYANLLIAIIVHLLVDDVGRDICMLLVIRAIITFASVVSFTRHTSWDQWACTTLDKLNISQLHA